MESHSENDLVVRDREGEWCLGEWCTPGPVALPAPFVNNYFYIKGMTLAIEIANHIGKIEDIPMLEERIDVRKRAITMAYFNSWDGNFIGNHQGANAFALDIGIGDARTKKNFINYYDKIGHYDTGIFGTDLVTKLLFEYGRGDVAYRLLTAESPWGFGKWKADGATTFWEYWYESRSHNHPMFGAVIAYLFDYVLGIQAKDGCAGYSEIQIAPFIPTALNRAAGHRTLPNGEVHVSWEKEKTSVNFTITIPDNLPAQFRWKETVKSLHPGTNKITVTA
jgi:alpha-L-rhamnosidase